MTKQLRNPYSKTFSDFYDIYAEEDFDKITTLVNRLLDSHNPTGTTLLELGCGTGKILEKLPSRYTFDGLDISEHMLAVAQKKFPNALFYHKDMSSFRIQKKYDAIICFSDGINHLHSFEEWEKTFQQVSLHLKKGGVFLFDMNAPIRLKRLNSMPRYVSSWLDDQFFTVKVSQMTKTRYNFLIELFTKQKDKVLLHEEHIMESSFPIGRVKKTLKNYFLIEEIRDFVRPKVSRETGKAIFVCRKK